MENSSKLHIDFGIPEHGWLPTIFKYQDYILEVEISDVPLDPMVQLCDALIQINKGIKEPNRIIWHLEPYCYYLQLLIFDGQYKAVILESDEFDSPSTVTKEILGNFESIILPLYRGLKKFWSQSFKKPHWDELNSERIDELTKLIKEKRT
tara:strand:+ start:262 stop:714 length:453 start_codon:yes stop_codon:yes gene_type:complete